MGEGNLDNNSPVSKKLRTDEGDTQSAKEEQPRPSSCSSSDAHNEPRSSSHSDDRREDEEHDRQSAGSALRKSQAKSKNAPTLSKQVESPQVQKAELTLDETAEISPTPTPVMEQFEFPAIQHVRSEHLDLEENHEIAALHDQLHVVQHAVFNSENEIMSSTLGGIPDQSARNSPTDQSVQAFANVQGHSIQQHNCNLPETQLPTELQSESYLLQNHGLQTQMVNGFTSRAQWAEWLHLQQQFAMHDPPTLSRSQDFQGQGYIHRYAVVPSDGGPYSTGAPHFIQFPSNLPQQGVGAYSMPSSVQLSYDAVPVPATFANSLGILGHNLETSHLAEDCVMNVGYIDLVHSSHSQQLAVRSISPVQVARTGQNRTLVPNSIYDPIYEALGLPVDPHLRFFLAGQHDFS